MAKCPSAFNKVELSAVSSSPHQHVAFNWNVQNFKALLDTAIVYCEEYDGYIASFPFALVIMNSNSLQLTLYIVCLYYSIGFCVRLEGSVISSRNPKSDDDLGIKSRRRREAR